MTEPPGDEQESCPNCGSGLFDDDVKCGACGQIVASTGVHRMIGGVVLEHYEIIDVLGQGGMSVVYKARHLMTDQHVAVKILPRELAAHSQVKSRFLEEARALAQLDHSNIVHLYNFGEDSGCLVLVMQFVEGKTFEREIMERGRVDWRDACRLCDDVLGALAYAHGRGIIHRDMKPSNVLLRADTGEATVMDFGIAKMTTSTRLTATGQTMGTVRYMSPEQVRGKPVDVRTDLYSLGITLYEAIAGDTPFSGETHFEIMTKHLNEEPPALSSFGVEVPAEVQSVIDRALRKEKGQRYQGAAEFQAALRALVEGTPLPVPPVVAGVSGADTLPSSVVAPAGAATAPLAEAAGDHRANSPAAARRWVWGALASAVAVASVALALWLGLRPAESEAPSSAPAPDSAHPVAQGSGATDTAAMPDPFLLGDLTVVVDRSYEDSRLRVLVVTERDPDEIAAAVMKARQSFADFLAQRTPPIATEVPPLTVVVVPESLICDRRLYESVEMFSGCNEVESHYRAAERTLYAADNGRLLAVTLPSEVALQSCVHVDPALQSPCTEAFADYEARLPALRK